jgi:hypothetical protein
LRVCQAEIFLESKDFSVADIGSVEERTEEEDGEDWEDSRIQFPKYLLGYLLQLDLFANGRQRLFLLDDMGRIVGVLDLRIHSILVGAAY